MKAVAIRTMQVSMIFLGFLLSGNAYAESAVGKLIPGAQFVNSAGTVLGKDPVSFRSFFQNLGEPSQELPSELGECFEPSAITDHAIFGRSACGAPEVPKVGIFRLDSHDFQEIDIGHFSDIMIRPVRGDAVLAHDVESGTASVIDENAEVRAYRFLRAGEKSLSEDDDGFAFSDYFGLSDSGALFVALNVLRPTEPQESSFFFRKILSSGEIDDFSPWWNSQARSVRSEQANISVQMTGSDDGKSQSFLLHNLDSNAETPVEIGLDDADRATLVDQYSEANMLYGRDGYLYTSAGRSIEFDGAYFGSHPVRIDVSNGEKLDLSCSLPPQNGKINEVLGTSSGGYVLASVVLDDLYFSKQLLLSPSELNAGNYCASVAVSFSKGCAGHLRRDRDFKQLYSPRGTIKNDDCSVTLTLTDAQRQPIVGARVDLAQARYGRRRSKIPIRVRAHTDASGKAKVKLTRALRRPGVCGWNVQLNSPRFQPNGISIRGASPDPSRCVPT